MLIRHVPLKGKGDKYKALASKSRPIEGLLYSQTLTAEQRRAEDEPDRDNALNAAVAKLNDRSYYVLLIQVVPGGWEAGLRRQLDAGKSKAD